MLLRNIAELTGRVILSEKGYFYAIIRTYIRKIKFLKSEFGAALQSIAVRFWDSIRFADDEVAALYEAYSIALDALLVALKQCYGVEYHVVIEKDSTKLDIVSQYGDLLLHYEKE